MAKLQAFVITSFVALAASDTFLAKSQLLQEDVKQLLLAEMLGQSDTKQLRTIEEELRPMYTALPKSEQGRLETSTVRYALHRYFLKQYGWFVKGLEAAGGAWNSSGATTVLKARAPSYILSILEEELQGKGMGLHELAVFAATMTDLIHAEYTGLLERIYRAKGMPTVGPVDKDMADAALHSFVVAHLLGADVTIEVPQDLEDMQARLDYQYPNQNETNMWVQDLRLTHKLQTMSTRNPFVAEPPSFDETSKFVIQFGHSFGSFQNLECHTLKRKLVEMEHQGSGRVFLSKFYQNALAGGWEFMESVEYLRNQGALDESDVNNPTVVIPNYMNSRMNCLTASDYYAVCCLNECDALIERLEVKLATPRAEPALIAQVVAGLQSDTVDAPRNLSVALVDRLHQIARAHNGLVPLHGRLFTQWMHHAYPRECQFPHTAGAVKPMYPVEWAYAMGEKLLEASQEVMESHAARSEEHAMKPMILPWSEEEELVAEHRQVVGTTANLASVKAILAVVALVSFARPLVRGIKLALESSPDGKVQTHLV